MGLEGKGDKYPPPHLHTSAGTTGVHLNIRTGPTFAVLVWTVPSIYNYKSLSPPPRIEKIEHVRVHVKG